MALKSGFWNAMIDEVGDYDRKYNGDDFSNAFSYVIGNGVINTNNGHSMEVTNAIVSGSNYGLTIKAGFGWINGKWFENPTDDNTTLASIAAPTQGRKRYDRIVVRRCNNIVGDNNREFIFTVIKGAETAETPVKPELTRDATNYDICLADILVTRGDTVTVSLQDQRSNVDVCGWVNGYFGDNFEEKMASMNVAVNNQLKTLQDRADDWVDNNSMTKTTIIRNIVNVSTAGNVINVGIASYNPDSDDLAVFVNGYQEFEGVDWTRSGTTVTFNTNKIAGTEIVFEVTKSLDGVGLNTAAQEIEKYQQNIQEINDYLATFNYKCNGVDDNIQISNILRTWLNENLADYSSMRLVIHGTFGATTPFGGTGTSADPYRWIETGGGSSRTRKAIVDFSNCSQIKIDCSADTYNIIFYGLESNIVGANVIATGGAGIYMFSLPTSAVINAENCRFWITATADASIARSGTFTNCRVSVTVTTADALCFEPTNGSLLRLVGGEYYAYTGQSNYTSAIIRIPASQTTAVALTYGINCPTVTRSGYFQTHSIYVQSNSATCSFTDTITTLLIVADGQNIRGTIALSKPELM